MINLNAKTVTDGDLTADGDRLTLAIPAHPYRLPHKGGGFVTLVAYEGDDSKANQSGCGCSECFTGKKTQTEPSANRKHNRMIARTEVVAYSGFENDGATLILTGRGVDGTPKQAWQAGTVVIQMVSPADMNVLLERIETLEQRVSVLESD